MKSRQIRWRRYFAANLLKIPELSPLNCKKIKTATILHHKKSKNYAFELKLTQKICFSAD